MSSARNPQTDGASKLINRMIENFIQCYCEYKQNNWDVLLPVPELVHNPARLEDLEASPFEVELWWAPRYPLDLITGIPTRVGAVDDSIIELKAVFK